MEERIFLTAEEKRHMQMSYERGSQHMERFRRPAYQHTAMEVGGKKYAECRN